MNYYHIDTSFLISALETLANPTTKMGKSETRSALEFCNLLILYDALGYDGKVGGRLLDRINNLLSNIRSQFMDDKIFRMLESRLVPIKPDDEEEREIIVPSAGDACASLAEIREIAAALDFLLSSYKNPISNPDDYLFKYLRRGRQPDSDFLESMFNGIEPGSTGEKKKITGGRFYYGLLKDDDLFYRIRELYTNHLFSEAVLPFLFTKFRMDFAGHRAGKSDEWLRDDIQMDYYPSFDRKKFLKMLGEKAENMPGNIYGRYEQRFRNLKVYSHKSGNAIELFCKQSKVLPSALKPALMDESVYSTKSKIAFLRSCLVCREERYQAIETIQEKTKHYEMLSDEEKEDRLFGYLSEILETNLDEHRMHKSELYHRLCWNLVSFKLRFAVGNVTELLEHLGVWKSREMKDAAHIADVIPMLAYNEKDWLLLCQIFGPALARLGEDSYKYPS